MCAMKMACMVAKHESRLLQGQVMSVNAFLACHLIYDLMTRKFKEHVNISEIMIATSNSEMITVNSFVNRTLNADKQYPKLTKNFFFDTAWI